MKASAPKSLPRLVDVARELNGMERAHVASIVVRPGEGGYLATFSVSILLPGAEDPQLPQGVQIRAIERYPDIERMIDWRTPAWDQILELIHDPALAKPEAFGSMEAVEKMAVRNAIAGESEADVHWIITMHGAARSEERRQWIASRETINA